VQVGILGGRRVGDFCCWKVCGDVALDVRCVRRAREGAGVGGAPGADARGVPVVRPEAHLLRASGDSEVLRGQCGAAQDAGGARGREGAGGGRRGQPAHGAGRGERGEAGGGERVGGAGGLRVRPRRGRDQRVRHRRARAGALPREEPEARRRRDQRRRELPQRHRPTWRLLLGRQRRHPRLHLRPRPQPPLIRCDPILPPPSLKF
jgi:hypothetical protein